MSDNDNKEKEWKSVKNQIEWTFWSILLMNWILIVIGVVMFGAALYSALWLQRLDLTSVLSLTGFGDIFTVFKFSMNRVQRCLGDQVQVHTAADGQIKQMSFVEKIGSNANIGLHETKEINDEIRKATLYTMELIQSFTEIAEPIKEKPWLRELPISYDELKLNGSSMRAPEKDSKVTVGEEITLSGKIINRRKKEIELEKIVIAIRPPGGTPDGGPFRFDFFVKKDPTIIKPGEPFEITHTKVFEKNALTGQSEPIYNEWFRKDWYAFMTCQTKEDGCWHDDHNKYWFELKKPNGKK